MKTTETISFNPISTEQTVRGDEVRVLTSARAGKIIPVAFSPILREDRVSKGSINIRLEMAETVYPLMNAVNVVAYAHFIPFSAFERFPGMDSFNRSYQKKGEPHNNTPIPFFHTVPFSYSMFWRTLGVHLKAGDPVNSAPIEAYNTLVNFRRKARSEKLPLRGLYDQTLADGFWKNPNLNHIVPDFDQAAMDGEIELQWATPKLRISGLGGMNGGAPTANVNVNEFGGTPATYPFAKQTTQTGIHIRTGSGGAPDVYAELQGAGVRVSLANIELAKQTAAFAKLRSQYSGMSDDHLMDLLMEGIRVPEEALRQPILLDRKSTIFGYSERFATDGDNLEKSVTTGETALTLSFRTPPMNTGGIVLITCEIVPEQLYERMTDTFLSTSDPDSLPNFMRDYLDPEKVEIVPNRYVDVLHATPTATFGYAPLNHSWKRSLSRIGGRYIRDVANVFKEDRQRFWSIEKLNPTLTEDFYLSKDIPHTVFKDQVKDPFEILALGNLEIVGNTVFGKTLEEDTNDYEEILAQVDKTRINQTPA